MAVKIRLTRLGDIHSPFYRVIVADSRSPRDGKFIELLGTYNPLVKQDQIKIDVEKAKAWIANGAQPTDTARDLLIKAGAIAPKKYVAKKVAVKPEVKAEVKKAE